jgi:glycosyltransferase involved in cell wall biosynthesis
VLYVGSTKARKNVSNLLTAFERLETDHELVIVGPDRTRGGTVEAIETGTDVSRIGYLPKQELKHVYANADCFVFPSLCEGFGIPPLEAMACETPVVASDRGSLPEVLGEFPTYVDPTDVSEIEAAMRHVVERATDETALRKAREHAAQYRWDVAAETLVEVCRRSGMGDGIQSGDSSGNRKRGSEGAKV